VLLEAVDVTFGYRVASSRPAGRSLPDRGSDGLVIRGVSLAAAPGAFIGILGPNGSGKTTLLRLIAGALAPTAGRISLGGQAIAMIPRRRLAQRLAVVPQETHLAFDYTALEIVLMGRYPHLGAFAVEGPADLAAARDAMATTGTEELASRAFATLSGGEKQRVIIASALAQLDARAARADSQAGSSAGASRAPGGHGPEALLLLDEPTASLDLRYQIEIASLLKRLNQEQGLTLVLSTHDLRLARALCTRLVLLSAGQVLADGRPSDMLTPDLIGRLYGIGADVAAPVLA
jgi:iron complex transport system ATP-binding protein